MSKRHDVVRHDHDASDESAFSSLAFIPQLFEQQCALHPDALAIDDSGQCLTYAALNHQANQLAHYLLAQGISTEHVVGVCLERSARMIVAQLGILKAGAAYVPIDPQYPAERRAAMLVDARVKYLIIDTSVRDDLPPGTLPIAAHDPALATYPTANPGIVIYPEQLAYILFTSGSTGRPKGVQVAHSNVSNYVTWHRQNYAITTNDRMMQFINPSFDAIMLELWPTLTSGASLHIVPEAIRADAIAIRDWLIAHAITMAMVPTALTEQLVALEWPIQTPLRLMFAGGEALRSYPPRAFTATLVNCYGPAETTVLVTVLSVPSLTNATHPPSIGYPIANIRIHLLDHDLRPVADGTTGELYVGGIQVTRGYASRPDLTAERFIPDPFSPNPGARLYRTGDLCRYRADGSIEYVGRSDFQVKIRGHRIELGEIEAALLRFPGVREGVVIAREDTPGNQLLVAYLAPHPTTTLDPHEIHTYLRDHLPSFMVPTAFVIFPNLPMTQNGKIDRRALPPPEQDAFLTDHYLAPRTPTEHTVTEICQDVLHFDRIGVEDNLFALGMHSLLVTRIISALRTTFGVNVPIQEFFVRPTISAVAEYLNRHEQSSALCSENTIQPIPRGHKYFADLLASLPNENTPEMMIAVINEHGPAYHVFPQSYAQQRLWLLDQLQPGNVSYNLGLAITFRGRIHRDALYQSIIQLHQRHEILRTTFTAIRSIPVQTIAPPSAPQLSWVDLTALDNKQEQWMTQTALIQQEGQRAFTLADGPLVRYLGIQVAPEEHLLIINMHHIITDGWSTAIMTQELAALYQANVQGITAFLPPVSVQYADYTRWQRAPEQDQKYAELVDYWCQELQGAPALLELPTDYPRPAVPSFNGASLQRKLPKYLIDRLAALCQQMHVTPFMFLLAVFDVVLSRLSEQHDVVVCIPIANRNHTQTESMLGFFVNTLVFRTTCDSDSMFRELLKRIQTTSLAAYDHQDVPFDRLLESLQPDRNLSYSPIFQVNFNMINVPPMEKRWDDITVSIDIHMDYGAKFDLTLYLTENAETIDLTLVYNPDLFTHKRMEMLLDQYQFVLAQVIDNPDMELQQIGLVPPSARAILPDPTLPLSDAWEGAVHQLFAHQAKTRPEQFAIIDGDTTMLTYMELETRSNQLAHYLRTLTVAPGTVFAIWAERSAEMVWAILGIFKAGAAYTILDPAYPPARLVQYMEQANPRGLLLLSSNVALPEEIRVYCDNRAHVAIIELFADPATGEASPMVNCLTDDLSIPVGPDDLASITFTSGSTGIPKGVLQRHGPLTHFLPWQQTTFALTSSDRYTLLSGLAHDPLQRDIFTPLCLGATLCVPDLTSITLPGRIAPWMRRMGITITNLTPAMLQLVTQPQPGEPPCTLPELRYAFTVGDSLKRHDVALLWKMATRVTCINMYGSTETQRAVSFYSVPREQRALNHTEKEVLPLGHGMRDVQILVLTPLHQLCGVGEMGEIYMRSPHLARGYLNDVILTEQRFIINPFTGIARDRIYRTGDMGRYLPDGSVEFATRNDQQVKIRGFRIELGEIEAALRSHEQVRDAVVVIYDDTLLIAYVVPSASEELLNLDDVLRSHLQVVLPNYMVPAHIMQLPQLPLTPNGKLDRQALPLPDGDVTVSNTMTLPSTPMEIALANIWREVLGQTTCDIHANFFNSGGHSLVAMQMLARIFEATGCEISLRHLFESPTIATLVAHIEASPTQRTQQRPELVALPRVFSRNAL